VIRCASVSAASRAYVEEIGQEFDVTRERIRQIESQALATSIPERARHLRRCSQRVSGYPIKSAGRKLARHSIVQRWSTGMKAYECQYFLR